MLIATLGSEPQVVTLALDLLRIQGYSVSTVKVVHTMGESVQAGLKMLAEEFRKQTACSYATVSRGCVSTGRSYTNVILNKVKNLSSFTAFRTSLRLSLRMTLRHSL